MIVHLNGLLVAEHEARISPFDRAFLLGDALYEGMRLERGVILSLDRHLDRLRAGLDEARMDGVDLGLIERATAELASANGVYDGFVYWQFSRGVPPVGGPRRSRVPAPGTVPTSFGYVEACAPMRDLLKPATLAASTRADTRWLRGHLKATSLLGGVLAAIEAGERGAQDAILIRDGLVTEGPSTNIFIAKDDRIVTPDLSGVSILGGVTRGVLLDREPAIIVRDVHGHELADADEIILTGTRTTVASVTSLDGRPVGGAGAVDERARPVARHLLGVLKEAARAQAESAPAAGSGPALGSAGI